jgi:aminoglycoside 6'-N-acetyltransferase
MPQPGYQFRPFESTDFAMIRQWLAMPHVVEWWGDPNAQFELVSADLPEPAMAQFIVMTGDEPFGYLQCYDLRAWSDPGLGPQPDGTRAIDQFIGRPDMIDLGHGSGFIRHFADGLLQRGIPRVITDPDPENRRAIRAYEKAGFVRDRIVDTVEGPALLMVRSP